VLIERRSIAHGNPAIRAQCPVVRNHAIDQLLLLGTLA
jgi:hypothetical protein